MTKDRDFKQLVRARMSRTGENYTTARQALLDSPAPTDIRADVPTAAEATPTLSTGVASTAWRTTLDPQAAAFYDRTVRAFFDDAGRLTRIPTKRRAKVVVLFELLSRFDLDRTYTEPEVNAVIGAVHEDFATLRRELVDYRWMERHGGLYRRATEWPVRSASVAQEVEPYESAWFSSLGLPSRNRPSARSRPLGRE